MIQILHNFGKFVGWLLFAGGTLGVLYIAALVWIANKKDK